MAGYPEQSHLKEWRITENGDGVQLRFVHKDDRADSLISLDYKQLSALVETVTTVLAQTIGIRTQHGKPLPTDRPRTRTLPIPTNQFQLHIAEDRSHAILEFLTLSGTAFRFAMEMTHIEGIARKILDDLSSYKPGSKVH